MANFKPFPAWRFNPEKNPIKDVIAPPYDVIKGEGQDALYERSPYNCIRLILNKITDQDTDEDNRYTRARDFFKEWSDQSVLIQDEEPSFYLYKQTFKHPETNEQKSRYAILGALKLEPFENEVVIPHEKTLAGPKEDRLKLIKTTEANYEPIFGLYDDPEQNIASIYSGITSTEPLFDVHDEQGIQQTIWKVSDQGQVEIIQNTLASKKIYIADGHHRYTTSLHYAQAQSGETTPGGNLASDYLLIGLVEFRDEGLVLDPTHRMVKSFDFNADLDEKIAVEKLNEDFEVEEKSGEELTALLKTAEEGTIKLGVAFKGKQYFLKLRDLEASKAKMPEGKPAYWYTLDVNIVSYLIFNALWGMQGEKDWEKYLGFTHSTKEALDDLGFGEYRAAILLCPPPVEVLREMGEIKELMPQKSTYFYPKLASGLLFYSHKTSVTNGV